MARPFHLSRPLSLLARHIVSAALASCLALAPPACRASDGGAGSVERGVKAAFLYKFLGYVEFPAAPADPAAPYVVGVAGSDAIAAELTRITAGRSVNNRPVTVRQLRDGDTPAGIHLLFVGASEAARTAALVRAAQQAGVLTVTETDNGLQTGSVINFRQVDDRIRFEVSLEAADRSNVKLSSRLLSVAYQVLKGGG